MLGIPDETGDGFLVYIGHGYYRPTLSVPLSLRSYSGGLQHCLEHVTSRAQHETMTPHFLTTPAHKQYDVIGYCFLQHTE